MSLPPAPQDISEHPAAGSVTAPADKQAQVADVDRKFQLYTAIQAFRQGRMPSNAQIYQILECLRKAEPVDVDKLSPGGKKLIHDAREIIRAAGLIVKKKNADELLQNFVWHTRDIDTESAKSVAGDVSQGERDKMSEDSRLAVRHLRTLLSLILTNSEVRKLLSDFSVIGRDLLAKGVSKAAEAIRPDKEAMSRVDKPAPNGEFITEGGQKTSTGEAPVLDVKIPHTDIRVEKHSHTDEPAVIRGEGGEATASQIVDKGKQSAQELFANANGQVTEQVHQTGQKINEVDGAERAATVSPVGSPKAEEKKRDFRERFKDVKDKFRERSPESLKKHVVEHGQKVRHVFTTEYFPPERRDQFIYRGKKVIVECQERRDYQDAVKWLLSIAEEYVERGQGAGRKEAERVGHIINDPPIQQAVSQLRQLLERFADGNSLHLVFDSISALNDDAHRDEEFRTWLKRLHGFVRKLLLETGYVLGDECTREGKEIRESGRKFWDQKYRSHFDNVFNSIGDWFSAMREDPLNKQFGHSWAQLTRDLLFDSEGSLKFKPDLWSDVRKVIVPALVDKVGYLPIPRIEYSDATLDLVLENLTLQGRNLFPNIVSVVAHNYMKFSPYNVIADEHHHEFTFTFAQMQADIRDVAFFFRKKTGFPKMADSGMADVVIGGSGITAIVHLISAGKDRSSVFKVKDVHVKVSSLKFSIHESKHDLLYKTLKPLATGLVKRQIKKAIADAIRTSMEYVDGQLVSVRDRMEEAKTNDEISRTQILQELFKRHKEEHIRPSESKSQFKVVSSKRSSVIDTGHPSGWVKRISESEEKATAGQDWRSEAFTIV